MARCRSNVVPCSAASESAASARASFISRNIVRASARNSGAFAESAASSAPAARPPESPASERRLDTRSFAESVVSETARSAASGSSETPNFVATSRATERSAGSGLSASGASLRARVALKAVSSRAAVASTRYAPLTRFRGAPSFHALNASKASTRIGIGFAGEIATSQRRAADSVVPSARHASIARRR